MRQKSLHYLFLLAIIGVGLAGCQVKDVDLSNVSVDSKVTANLSIPVGEISTSFGDLIGLISGNSNVRINNDSILELYVDQHYTRQYHAIDLKRYLGQKESDMLIYPLVNTPLIPQGTQLPVPFTMVINFDSINDNTSDERLDSLVIERAKFTTKITTNNFPINKNDIEKVTMVLGQQFRHHKGQKEFELPGFDFDKDIPIELDDFTMVMMLDESQPPSMSNVVNNADIQFKMYLNTKQNLEVDQNTSGFHFTFSVEMMEYSALYGFFGANETAQDADKVEIPLILPGNEPMVLPVSDPKLQLMFTYGLSIPIQAAVNALYTTNADGTVIRSATWDDSTHAIIPLEALPVTVPLDATITDTITLDKDPKNGHIDHMFEDIEVKYLGYDYKVDVNTNYRKPDGTIMDQFRLTKNTMFDLDMHVNVPMKFNKGLRIAYTDTIKDINLSQVSLDSLYEMTQKKLKVDSANLSLYILSKNDIPVSLNLTLTLLDDNGQDVGLNINTIQLPQESEKENFIKLNTEDFEKLARTKSMKIRAQIGDEQKPSAFQTNKRLTLKIGVTGDIQAVLNLNNSK